MVISVPLRNSFSGDGEADQKGTVRRLSANAFSSRHAKAPENHAIETNKCIVNID